MIGNINVKSLISGNTADLAHSVYVSNLLFPTRNASYVEARVQSQQCSQIMFLTSKQKAIARQHFINKISVCFIL